MTAVAFSPRGCGGIEDAYYYYYMTITIFIVQVYFSFYIIIYTFTYDTLPIYTLCVNRRNTNLLADITCILLLLPSSPQSSQPPPKSQLCTYTCIIRLYRRIYNRRFIIYYPRPIFIIQRVRLLVCTHNNIIKFHWITQRFCERPIDTARRRPRLRKLKNIL